MSEVDDRDARAGSTAVGEEGARTMASGRTSFGKYQAFASLGSGGMADVYLTIVRGPKGFNKLAVVKSLKKELARSSAFVDMFLDEARLAARLNHPNVVHTHEVGDSDGVYFIAMEFLEGQSLNRVLDALKKRGDTRFEAPVAARLVSDALAGLHYAHELRDYDGKPLGIIHRDISPHNLFVTYEGQVKVVDFGIAKAASSSTQTEVGVLKGKVAYMSPEQAMGDVIDRRTDLYAMGICLWEALTLESLARGESGQARLARLLSSGAPRVSSIVPDVDPRLDDIVAKALDKDRKERFQTAAEFREALETYIRDSGVVVRQEEIGRRVSEMFASVRAEVDRKVRAQMAAADTATSMADLAPLSLGGGMTPSQGQRAVEPTTGTGARTVSHSSGTGSGAGTGSAGAVGLTVGGAPSRRAFGAVIAIAAALALLAVWQFTKRSDGATQSQAVVAPLSSASPASAPVASAEIADGRTESFGPLPVLASAAGNPLSDDKIALGRMLYYEARLSKNQDNSCNSCHLLDKYGVDSKKVSTGHAQQQGTRNSLSVYNSAGFFALMWDGKFSNVEDQVKGPLYNPVEMASSPKRVEAVLGSIPEYVQAFAKAFPADKPALTADNAARAIGAFERKLFAPSRWEKYLAGEKSALTDAEKVGFNTFVDTGCPTCHFGPYVGATMFQKLGLVKAWPTTRDRGRYELTQKNEDYMVFRVPSLRNVAMTGPYLHDGSVTSLGEVVHLMSRHQIGKEIGDAQADAIVAWFGSLTGELPKEYIAKPDLPPNGKKTPPPEL